MQLPRTKDWRESRGLTQRELAAQAGVGEVTVARVETGSSVTPPTARKIAEALGVAVADLIASPPVPLDKASSGSPSASEAETAGAGRAEVLPPATSVGEAAQKLKTLSLPDLRKIWQEVVSPRMHGFSEDEDPAWVAKELHRLGISRELAREALPLANELLAKEHEKFEKEIKQSLAKVNARRRARRRKAGAEDTETA